MEIKEATFVKSSTILEECPPPKLPEYVFIGRSNVGKSSLINMLTNHKSLAKISSTPGKTQTINHFLINNTWYLVDLPGYGWAKVGKAMKSKWEENINDFLLRRETIACVFVLIDMRHPPQNNDMLMLEWLAKNEIPMSIVFTKADKLTKGKRKVLEVNYFAEMKETWESFPDHFVTSSANKSGKFELLEYIDLVNQSLE